jgi:hypothetical protein
MVLVTVRLVVVDVRLCVEVLVKLVVVVREVVVVEVQYPACPSSGKWFPAE